MLAAGPTREDRRRWGFRPQPQWAGWPQPRGPNRGAGWASVKLRHLAGQPGGFSPRGSRSTYSVRRNPGRPRWGLGEPRTPYHLRRSLPPTLAPRPALRRRKGRRRRSLRHQALVAELVIQNRPLPDPDYGVLKVVGAILLVAGFWWEVARRRSRVVPDPLWGLRRMLRDPRAQWRADHARPELPPSGPPTPTDAAPPRGLLELLGLERTAIPLEEALESFRRAAPAAAAHRPYPAGRRWLDRVEWGLEEWLRWPGTKTPPRSEEEPPFSWWGGNPPPKGIPFPDWGGATPAFSPLPWWVEDWLGLLFFGAAFGFVYLGYWWERMPLRQIGRAHV